MRVLELYAGIGGCAAALTTGPPMDGVAIDGVAIDGVAIDGVAIDGVAIDQSRVALEVYAANFPGHRILPTRVDSLSADALAAFEADLWWASPPCQPFTVRGRRRDLDDPRAETFVALVDRLAAVRPAAFALENVAGFLGSRAHRLLLTTLERSGYVDVREHLLCPSELGVPNRRPRAYIVATRDRSITPASTSSSPTSSSPTAPSQPLRTFLDADPDPSLRLDAATARRYRGALHVVDADDPEAVTTCFTAAYGRSPVRSGSYLRLPDGGLRRFSPAEVLRLLGFPEEFRLPASLSRRKAWHLAGNSLSVPAVRAVLASLGALDDPSVIEVPGFD